MSQHPRTKEVIRGLAGLELVVVVDQFLTDTARLAHYVLPAKTLFEEEDLVTAYWHPYLQLRQKVLDPPEGVKTETEIWRELCVRFGFGTEAFDMDPVERLRAMLPEGREDALGRSSAAAPGPVRARGRWPGRIAGSRLPPARWNSPPRRPRSSGVWTRSPDMRLLPKGTAPNLATDYPLQLLTCKTRERIHSQFGNLDWITGGGAAPGPGHPPRGCRSRGLKEGDVARIWNGRGSAEAPVHLNPGIRKGVVHVLEGRCVPGRPVDEPRHLRRRHRHGAWSHLLRMQGGGGAA